MASTGDSLKRLYQRTLSRIQINQIKTLQLYEIVKSKRFQTYNTVLTHHDVLNVSGINHFPSYFTTFGQSQINNVSNFLLKHVEFSKLIRDALRCALDDEIWLRSRHPNMVIYNGRISHLINGINLFLLEVSTISARLGNTFQPSSMSSVTFDPCDVTCVKQRGLFVLQEFQHYLQLSYGNFYNLLMHED
ncbi:hypothetical protein BSL78_20456 [Apostichopus japonicus]|uniref:Uncharacterized protein n=1 Tax=Stichopus japonicus TaxID=307972 RepID=A0A2G8K3V5_STIJA|nr:hypothetical protein BSL78_20456 [Apostichopus japonicus]